MDRADVVREFVESCGKVGITKNKITMGFASVLHQLAATNPPKKDAIVFAALDGEDLAVISATKDVVEDYKKGRDDLIISHEWFYYMGH